MTLKGFLIVETKGKAECFTAGLHVAVESRGGGVLLLHRTNLLAGAEVDQGTDKQRSVLPPPLLPLLLLLPLVLDFKLAEMDLKPTDA